MSNRNNNQFGNVFSALVVGAVIGAAGMFLSKKENRQKVKEKSEQFKSELQNQIDKFKQQAAEIKTKGRIKVAEELEKAQKKLETSNSKPSKKPVKKNAE